MKSSVIHVLNHFLQQSFKKHIHTIHDHTNQSMETPLDMEKLQKIQSMLPMLMIHNINSSKNVEKEIVKCITDDGEIVVCDINEILKKKTILKYNETNSIQIENDVDIDYIAGLNDNEKIKEEKEISVSGNSNYLFDTLPQHLNVDCTLQNESSFKKDPRIFVEKTSIPEQNHEKSRFLYEESLKTYINIVQEDDKEKFKNVQINSPSYDFDHEMPQNELQLQSKNEIENKCEICEKLFSSKQNLKQHITQVHEGNNQKCEFCIKSFCNNDSLKRHINTFHTRTSSNDSKMQNKYKCKWCVKTFKVSSSLKRHIGVFHQGQIMKEGNSANLIIQQKQYHECDICSKLFFKESKLIGHKMKKHGIKFEKAYEGKNPKCEFCIKSFVNKSSLKRHINTFHTNSSRNDSKNQKKYKCQWCVKTFTCSNSLKRHISTFHQGQMPTCYICCKLFFNASKLIQHEMKEHGIKSKPKCKDYNGIKSKPKCKDYKCDICEKSFTKLHNLNVHKRMHGNVRPFCCSNCGQDFRYENYFF